MAEGEGREIVGIGAVRFAWVSLDGSLEKAPSFHFPAAFKLSHI